MDAEEYLNLFADGMASGTIERDQVCMLAMIAVALQDIARSLREQNAAKGILRE